MIKTVKLAADTFPPYQFFNANKEIEGLDYEIIKKSFELVGYDIEVIILEDWTLINNMVEKGKLHGAFQVQETPERLERFLFSDLLRSAKTEILTSKKDLKLFSYNQLVSKKLIIGILKGYSYGQCIDTLPDELKKTYTNQEILLQDINNGNIDLGVFDSGVKSYLVKKNGLQDLISITNLSFVRPLGLIFNKNNIKIRDDFNIGLKKLIETNQYFEIIKYWNNK